MAFQLGVTLDLLGRTPGLLRGWLTGLPDEVLATDEGPDTFSPHDVVAHLVQGEEEDWMPRTRILLEHGESRPFEPFDPFGFKKDLVQLPTGELLDRFEELRRANLTELAALGLGPADLERRGM